MSKRMLVTMGSAGAGHTGTCTASCNCRKNEPADVSSITPQQVSGAVERGLTAAVAQLRDAVQELRPEPSLAQHVEAELREHPDVVAYVDEETGVVNSYLLPKPYWQTPASNADGVADADLQELRARVNALEVELRQAEARSAPFATRVRIEQELEAARRELDAAEDAKRQQRRREQGSGRDDTPPAR